MTEKNSKINTFENIRKILEKISKHLNLSEKELNLLLTHKSIQKAVINADGKEYDSWRIIHNDALGPGKGGIRFHPEVSEDEIKSLSFWMSLKTSLLNLPYGGAKGGVKINPKELNKKSLEKVSRGYIQAFHDFIGQDKDIPAPDVYTNPEIMGWMLDEFEKIKGRHEPAAVTGKPLILGGCVLRQDATSKGGVIILEQFLNKILHSKEASEKISIAVQGFGNAGMNIAEMLYDKNYKIVAVSDSRGGVFSERGIDVKKIISHKKSGFSVFEFKDLKKISNQELLELDVDVLILAALENQITEKNAEEIKAKYILELANGPITYDADDVLFRKGIIVIPDILANAGGVVASYCEWCQNKTGNILPKELMEKNLEEKMINAFNKVYELYDKEKDFSLRFASYAIAIKRILNAEKARKRI